MEGLLKKEGRTTGYALPQIPSNLFATHMVLLGAVSCPSLHLVFDN